MKQRHRGKNRGKLAFFDAEVKACRNAHRNNGRDIVFARPAYVYFLLKYGVLYLLYAAQSRKVNYKLQGYQYSRNEEYFKQIFGKLSLLLAVAVGCRQKRITECAKNNKPERRKDGERMLVGRADAA